MKTLIISATGRKGGTIERACEQYADKSENHELVNLFDYDIKPCIGCLKCTKDAQCNIEDDFDILFDKMQNADHIVIGTPIYCHNVPGILKVFIDRCCSKVVPFIQVDLSAGLRAKLKMVKAYQKQFAENAPLSGKTFTTITACSTPNKNNKDMKSINMALKQFIQEEMKGKITEDIRYTDTLFQFKELTI